MTKSFSGKHVTRLSAAILGVALTGATAIPSALAEPASCTSTDPSQWPAPSKPYFMIIVDTSGSMSTSVCAASANCPSAGNPATPPPSCPTYPANRLGHARCAVKNTIEAFGEVNFGLAGYAWRETGCTGATCFTGCSAQYSTSDNNKCGPLGTDPDSGLALHEGAEVFVPMLVDHYWSTPPSATNVPTLLSWVDNDCTNSVELGQNSSTPLGGALLSINRYFSGTFRDPFDPTYPLNTPLTSPLGTQAQGERSCRSVNIILITDGDEECDKSVNPSPIANGCRSGQTAYLGTSTTGERLASYEADKLFTNGVSVGGQTFKVKTNVIGFVGATTTSLDHIAACGGTGSSYSTSNESTLSSALATIIAGAIPPETCDNTDNNCNGCTDEGFTHYCDVSQTCCANTDDASRTACLTSYQATITAAKPAGDITKLPCTSTSAQTDPAHWLCYNPGEICDGIDNNCHSGADEGVTQCGSPLHCPQTEVCNGLDDDCNGQIDEGNVCGTCTPTAEVCDGCDNDCNGIADDNIAPVPCGFSPPSNCSGTITCVATPVAIKGACGGPGPSACSNNPQPEICDGIDNNCNGSIDEGVAPQACVPAGTPGTLVYGGNSQCKMGSQTCGGTCQGFVGPGPEVCDGVDNDCDGKIDNGTFGVGLPCGTNTPPCTPGLTSCVNGALVCTGGKQPQPEVCDGIDNNCDGKVDNAPLADAPAPGQNGCWALPGNCCDFPVNNPTLHWCPPTGATCNGPGSLSAPCENGSLACAGATGWVCQNPKQPSAETCDGLDNDCNGQVDDGNLPGVGGVCGQNVGECKTGIEQCTAGVLTCAGSVGPSPETCDGKDNDCDNVIDNGISTGGPCWQPYDTTLFPGDPTTRQHAPCQPGILQCNGMGGTACIGGVGPTPEVCDGIDNDCDGTIDEAGMAPDGIDGSANPNGPSGSIIGGVCGNSAGDCKAGTYACSNGEFVCSGGKATSVEVCDCEDNDCDGTVDNQSPNGPALCGAGKTCVKSQFGCQCAALCMGEFPCPGGQTCEKVMDSATGTALVGAYCVSDQCGDCAKKTIKDGNGKVVCAPPGTALDNCAVVPTCVCKGSNCADPCTGVSCSAGTVCAEVGPNAGSCVKDTCFNNPCVGCGSVCNLGSCVTNPCPGTCKADEECRPKSNFLGFDCIKPCAGVTCSAGQTCVAGQCVATCEPACAAGQVCDLSKTPPACSASKCNPNPCAADGSFCDPLTGMCGNDPCAGITCPAGSACVKGECANTVVTGSGSGTTSSTGAGTSSTGAGGSQTSSTGTSATSSAATAGGDTTRGNWGLATGGGGCACQAGARDTTPAGLVLALLGVAVAAARRRRRTESESRTEVAR